MSTTLDYENVYALPKKTLNLPNKILVSPGPTNFSPRVLSALSSPTMGSCCPELFQIMEDIRHMLKYVFQTKNEVTLALQTSGTGGVEASICNLVDPGEKVIVAVAGLWGERTVEKAIARGADVIQMETNTGEIFSKEELEKQVKMHRPVALYVTHGESSGGTVQNLEGLGNMCHKYGCLLIVDAVVSLGGVPFFTDRWEIDVVVSATQKAIGSPPGLSLITMSPAAANRMKNIKHLPPFYLDIKNICRMWGIYNQQKSYYITYNSHMLNALREALTEVVEEGLVNRWERHRICADRFWTGMKRMGMKMVVEKIENRLIVATCYWPPIHVNNADLINYLSEKHQIVVGFGVCKLARNSLRVGFMSYNARVDLIDHVLKCIEEGIAQLSVKDQLINV